MRPLPQATSGNGAASPTVANAPPGRIIPKLRVEIVDICDSPCEIAVLGPESGDLTRGIIKNGYFNPCFGEVRRRDGGARKKRKPGGEAGLEREEKKGFSYCGLAVVITI